MPTAQERTRAALRRQEVGALYLRGYYQSEIARQLRVTQQQISLDLQLIRRAWLASAIRDFDAAKAQELQKLDLLEREAWQAWERSQQPKEITRTEQIEADGPGHGGGPARLFPHRKASVRREGSAGDPRYLEQIQKCIAQRCALLGLTVTVESTTLMSTGMAALLEVARTTMAPPAASLPLPMSEA